MNTKGFTLIELLVVVLIIGVLSAVALPQYTTAIEKSRATEALTLSGAVRYAAERYYLQKDEWPSNANLKKLDIELPKNTADCTSSGGYGGKNFCISVSGTAPFVIRAQRIAEPKYTIETSTSDGTNWTRKCKYNTADESAKFCYAIAGSKTLADNGF